MSKVAVYNQVGEKSGDIDLNAKVFGIERIDASLVHLAVRTQRNNARTAIAHTKNRGEVTGSGKKPWKQKGTGRARAGSVRSPLWRKGGITFGPRSNRNFSLKINKSALRKALFTILTDKVKENKLVIVDDFKPGMKTNELAKQLKNFSDKTNLGKKLLLIIPSMKAEHGQAANNLKNVKVIGANQLNVIDLLNNDVVITKDAVKVIEQTYLK